MAKREYAMVEIKRLPPGVAEGAYDLQRWAGRRLAGQFGSGGSPTPRMVTIKIQCSGCGKKANKTFLGATMDRATPKFVCSRCGSIDVKWWRTKETKLKRQR
jgi:ribosomal protein L44E